MFARAAKESARTRAVSNAPDRTARPRAADRAQEPERLAAELERASAGIGPQWSFGEIPVLEPGGAPPPPQVRLQRKLAVGSVDDPLEREADAVADAVVRMPDSALAVSAAPPQVSRKCAECEEEKEKKKKLQMEPAVASLAGAVGEAPAIVRDVLRSPGQPLEASARAFLEPRFGYDFSDVRVHDDARTGSSARALGAHAYAAGSHIAFAPGQYRPRSIEGRELIAHELAHTIQQTAGAPIVRRQPDPAQASEQSDLDKALGASDWAKAAEILNGYNMAAMGKVLEKLHRGVVASIYAGAIENRKVGPDSAVAKATRAVYLDINYENELKRNDWSAAAKYLNGFNRDDILKRLQKLDVAKWQAIHDGAVSNPEVGDKSQVAEVARMLITQQKNARAPEGDVLGVADAVPHQGDPQTDPNYIEMTTKGIGIPIWGGPLYLKQTDTPGWADCVVVLRSDVFFVDSLAKQKVEIQTVFKTREAALNAVKQFAVEGAYAFYQGPQGRIVPTIISATTAPGITQTAQIAIKGEGEDAKAAERLSLNLLMWYIGARYPAKVGETSAAKQVVKSSIQDVLGETEYAALKASAEAAKAAHPELAALSTDEIIAIRAYSGESWSYLNQALRLKDAKELTRLEQFISLMKSGLNKLPVFKGTVTRTIALPTKEAAQKYTLGATVVEDAFTSTTFGKAVAQREGNVLLTIESSTGRNITAAAVHDESEVLFAPGAKFIVTKVQQFGGALVVSLKEVL
jgi:hypothetical protein